MVKTLYFPLWRVMKGRDEGNLLFFVQSGCAEEKEAKIIQAMLGALLLSKFGMMAEGVKRLDYDAEDKADCPHRPAMTRLGLACILEGPALLGKTADGSPFPEDKIRSLLPGSPEGKPGYGAMMNPEQEAQFQSQFDELGRPLPRTLH